MVVVPPVISEQPLVSLIVAFTLTAVVALAMRIMLEALLSVTAVTVGAALPTTTVDVAVVPANALCAPFWKLVTSKIRAPKENMLATRTRLTYSPLFLSTIFSKILAPTVWLYYIAKQ